MSDDNFPDDLRIPLNELQADAKYLIGRVMQDAESGPMIATAILEKLSQIESASYRAILGSNPPADDLLRQAIEALRICSTCSKTTSTRSATCQVQTVLT